MRELKSLLVYCGASAGEDPVYRRVASELGKAMAEKKIRLVYGGGSIGLMGVVADAVMQNGGEVHGVIPGFLDVKEVRHKGITQMHVVSSMHERKAMMEKLCDAAIALPGGFGTMDEFFEMLTWAQLGLHSKPLGLLNVKGFYDHFLAQLDVMVKEKFLTPSNRALVIGAVSVGELLGKISSANPVAEKKWMNEGQE
ncbi:MAG TPA: TIGR00730 family Rossman fold protein [Bacteroidia bacterium]|nr:TIGR00730 family Rossman fold protein [Bacteroidia bacterium]